MAAGRRPKPTALKTLEGIGKIGYVANSTYTVLGDLTVLGDFMTGSERKQRRKLFMCCHRE